MVYMTACVVEFRICVKLTLVMELRPLGPGERFSGSQDGLIVGIDFGTTFSGVSYAFLHPGEIPEIQAVTKLVSTELL